MSNCPSCNAAMKPLFSGEFCPNECDRPESAAHQAYLKKLRARIDAAVRKLSEPKVIIQGFNYYPNFVPVAPAAVPYSPGPDDCRDPYCRAKGTKTFIQPTPVGVSYHYTCNLCSKKWDVIIRSNGSVVQGTFTTN